MTESLSGGTTHLLRTARSGCQSAVSFVALSMGNDRFATAAYPPSSEQESTAGVVDELVHRLWRDPGLAHGRAVVRTIAVGDAPGGGTDLAGADPSTRRTRPIAVAALPLVSGDGAEPFGLLGVARGESASPFGVEELQVLSRIAQRLTSYVSAREAVRRRTWEGAAAAPTSAGASGAPAPRTRHAQWWPVEPGRPASGRPAEKSLEDAVEQSVSQSSGQLVGQLIGEAVEQSVGSVGSVGEPGGSVGEPGGAVGAVGAAGESFGRTGETGIVSLSALLGRTGRLLGAGAEATGSLVVLALELRGPLENPDVTTSDVVRALRDALRFDDPVARLGTTGFVVVVPVVPGSATADAVVDHLVGAVQAAVDRGAGVSAGTDAGVGAGARRVVVRAAHVISDLSGNDDADELVRAAVGKLRAG